MSVVSALDIHRAVSESRERERGVGWEGVSSVNLKMLHLVPVWL